MRASFGCLLGMLCLAACPAEEVIPVAGTSSEGTASSSAATTELPSEETGSSSGSSGSETSGATATSLGGESSSSGGSEETATSTGGDGGVIYSAIALPGGLDRIRIHKADFDAGTCTWMVLVAPPIGTRYAKVDVPEGWSVESITINDVAASCGEDTPAMFGGETASGASGTVGFGMLGGAGIYPCTLDVDATLEFEGLLPTVPTMDTLMVSNLDVSGC